MGLIRPTVLSLSVISAILCLLLAIVESAPVEAKEKKQAVSEKLVWQNNYSQTLKLAASQKKWVLIDVYTEWCGWCKRLDADVYADPKIARFLNKSFVCMKADAEKGDGKMIAQKYGIDGFPVTLILFPNGKEKGRVNGYFPPNKFPTEISKIIVQGK